MFFRAAWLRCRGLCGTFAVVALIFGAGLSPSALGQSFPNQHCYSGSDIIEIDNEQVVFWKKAEKNQFRARAHVYGKVSRVFGVRGGDHVHFEIQIGPATRDVLEVVYNTEFGRIQVAPGMDAQVCGDFINAFERNGYYSASPSGAIIHWVHERRGASTHDEGFVILEDHLFGHGPAKDLDGPI